MIKMFTVGRFFTNCYIVGCEETREAILLDPGFDSSFEAEGIFNFIDKNRLTLKIIVDTHGHPDHTCGNGTVKRKFRTPISIHEYDAQMLGEGSTRTAKMFGFEKFSPEADMLLHDEDLVRFGKRILKVMHTPGHSRGSVSLLGENEVFTGDTLFAGSIGRTDFPESSGLDMKLSLSKLAKLPDHLVVYPGHGPMSTIGEEKRSNPFLRSF